MTRFFSVLQFFVASHCRLQTKVTCRQARAQSLLNMVLRVISLVQRATGSMVSQWRLVSVTDSGQKTEMSLVKVSLCSYLLSSTIFGNRISTNRNPLILKNRFSKVPKSFVPRDTFVVKMERELCHLKCALMVSELSRNGHLTMSQIQIIALTLCGFGLRLSLLIVSPRLQP